MKSIRSHLLWALLLFACAMPTMAQDRAKVDSAYCAHFYSESIKADFYLNPYEAAITVPGYEFIGKTHGFLRGRNSANLYGVWFVLSVKPVHNGLRLRLANDTGADSQTVTLQADADGNLRWTSEGHNNLTRAEGRKLVKLPAKLNFKRIDYL
ncbi:MAG: hypothetical protein IJ553_01750 [Alloprevotella sp.]|nr:hypothetical protein [Alloprevotella sp.]